MKQSFQTTTFGLLLSINLLSNCHLFQQKPDPEPTPDTTMVTEPKEEKWEEVVSIIKPEPSYKLIAKTEKVEFFIEPKFGMVEPFQDKLAFVKYQEKKKVREGYIDLAGNLVLVTNFDYPNYSFYYGLAKVVKDNKTGFIGKNGKVEIPLQFQDAGDFTDILTWVKANGKYGFINLEGKIVIEPVYDLVESFTEGLACVSQKGKFGYINERGRMNQILFPREQIGRAHV